MQPTQKSSAAAFATKLTLELRTKASQARNQPHHGQGEYAGTIATDSIWRELTVWTFLFFLPSFR